MRDIEPYSKTEDKVFKPKMQKLFDYYVEIGLDGWRRLKNAQKNAIINRERIPMRLDEI